MHVQLHLRSKTNLFWFHLANKKHYCSSSNFSMSDDSEVRTNGEFCKKYQWKPSDIINRPYRVGNGHVLLVLNREVRIPECAATELWQIASVRCCVDGGSNRWREFLKLHSNMEFKLKPPDLITGDFDSITNETKQYFNGKGTQYIHTPDQDETDFTKAVQIVKPILEEKHIQDILVYQETSGRFDQIMTNINTLYKFQKEFFNIYLLSGNSLTWLLKPGKHSITIPSDLVQDQRWCALIPVGQEAANVTTNGLKWNLTKDCLKFGGLISTSNTYSLCLVEIETETPLIWSMAVFDFSDN